MGKRQAKKKVLIWDIETSPNIGFFWRPGYKVTLTHDNILKERAIICICWKWAGERKVHHLTWDKNQCDKKMVKEFLKVAKEADELVAHNGDHFDMKWFNTRVLFHELGPVPQWKTVDTLKIARKYFNFNSNRLDYLGKFLFGEGKISTSFNLWYDICINNCPTAMDKMVKYCKQDVRLLEKVWKELEPYSTVKSHVGVANGLPKWTCPFQEDQDSDYCEGCDSAPDAE